MQLVSPADLDIDIDQALAQVEFFQLMSRESQHEFKQSLNLIQLDSQDILMHQDDEAEYVYIVFCGKLRVFNQDNEGKQVVLAYLSQGNSIGEMAVLSGHKRSATVQATRFSILMRISNEKFMQILKMDAELSVSISKQLVQRLESSNERAQAHRPPRHVIQALGVVSSGDHDINQEFIEKFQPCLSEYKTVFKVTSSFLQDQGFNLEQQNSFSLKERTRLALYLSDLENKHEFILFDAGSNFNAWARFVLNNADALVCVADAQSNFVLSPIEKEIYADSIQYKHLDQYFVLVHPTINSVPQNTSCWLEQRRIYSSHHVAYDEPRTLRSLARIMTGCCINLVLSGGGARGYVHIGVLKALREYGIEVDTVSGVSMGSIIGAMIAMEKDPDAIASHCLDMFSPTLKALSTIQLPFTSMMKPKGYRKLLHSVYKDLLIEDLWKKYFCVTVNMTQAKEYVFDSGLIKDAVMGSAGLPMMASPLISEGDMHVDGCVLNTMPVDIAKQRYGGEVICVEIARDSTYPRDTEHTIFPSSWQILRRMLNPFKKNLQVPMLTEIMTKTIQMANYKKTKDMAELADVVIAPDISSVKPSDHPKVKEIAELGYNEAKIQIEKWLEKKKASQN